ncbi:MAG TPA: nucleoside triphosphate pyrophosphohydrolase [Smithellaceae bacterium]|nr:nucleoside triphosphate pyrophosphohydrolase [Smithellaceae bacterium]HRS89717.1 nucleoside triphosphate pyrophosphohydrolase [Smithellaceae bacterium]HRV26851.1 nucleoside triphosphate pyrophosphohydrolase [Smithellaceae bacterium]
MKTSRNESRKIGDLISIIKQLRSPDGCPWDKKQKPADIGKYILEEAYEVVDALENKNVQNIKEELGDLLFQILFLAEMYEEESMFFLNDVITEIRDKMIRRHPHVFGDKKVDSVEAVKENWQKIKKMERANKKDSEKDNLFANVPRSLPALKRAQEITSLASDYGFDWSTIQGVEKKLQEELNEFSAALKKGEKGEIEEELGDIIFTLVNLCRFAGVDAEAALTKTINKFLLRFSHIEEKLSAQGKSLQEASLAEMDAMWNEAKEKEE